MTTGTTCSVVQRRYERRHMTEVRTIASPLMNATITYGQREVMEEPDSGNVLIVKCQVNVAEK